MAAPQSVLVPLEDYNKVIKDSETLENVKALLTTEFPDDTCQMIAIKSLLGIVEEDDAAAPDTDPSDPGVGDPGNSTP